MKLGLFIFLFLLWPVWLPAQQPELVFGMSTALSGPAQDLGQNMKSGVLTAFAAANALGGIKGRQMKLIALDDGYEPNQTGPNMHRLIDSEKVLGIIGNVGTPTAIVAIPIAMQKQRLFFAAFTGAGVLRKDPPDRYVINYRASYAEETGAMIDGLINNVGLKVEDIAFFTQRDGYGDAGFTGGIEALKRHGLRDENSVLHSRYERNTLAVENALADILSTPELPKAVVMVGAYAPCARFIKLAKENGLNALFLNVSFVGGESLVRELGSSGNGVLVTQVVPPEKSDAKIVKEFLSSLGQYRPGEKFSFGALEGYIAARILLLALDSIKFEISPESLVDALESLGKFSIGTGSELSLGPLDHQASNQVWLTRIQSGSLVPTEWDEVRLESTKGK